jgi:hypothetical protein
MQNDTPVTYMLVILTVVSIFKAGLELFKHVKKSTCRAQSATVRKIEIQVEN